MELNLKATNVFKKIYTEYKKETRLIVLQGGRGSSKTWSLAQLFLSILTTHENTLLTVCRKTLPALRASAYRDFFEILQEQNLYNPDKHNKTDLTYVYGSNEIEFIAIDQPQKVRGRKRQYLWMNEANEFTYEDFRQLNMRTDTQIFMDFNPSMEFHWIYDDILTRDDCAFIKSTYLDNSFLEPNIVKEIERLKSVDENYWRIYGLGERGVAEATIYKNWDYVDSLPKEYDERIYGLDFGFNNPTALIEVRIKDKDIYVDEKLYESHLTNSQLIDKLPSLVNQENYIYPDHAEPQRIEEISQAGFNTQPSDKDVAKGIDTLRSRRIFITKSSTNLLKEIKTYSWKQKDGKSLDEPVKDNDHCLVGDTNILIANGKTKKLKSVKVGEYVKTQNGINKVLLSRLTRKNADISEVTFSNGYRLKGTGDHKIYTNNGLIGIDSLRYDDIIETKESKWQKQLFLPSKDTTGMVNTIIQLVESKMVEKDYIKQFGNIIMEKYQKECTSIILTEIEQTMISLISNLKTLKSIYQSIGKSIGQDPSSKKELESIVKRLGHLLKNGIALKKELSGIKNTGKKVGLEEKHIKRFVEFVEKDIELIFQLSQNIAIRTVKRKHCEPEDVYNLTIENEHNYYANGILVKNCMDSLRYAVHSHLNVPEPDITFI